MTKDGYGFPLGLDWRPAFRFRVRFDRRIKMLQVTAADERTGMWGRVSGADERIAEVLAKHMNQPVGPEPKPGEIGESIYVTPTKLADEIRERLEQVYRGDAFEVVALPDVEER